MIRLEGTNFDMLRKKRFVVLWHTELAMGWMIRGEPRIEKTMESSFTYVADVSHLHSTVWLPWVWYPQGVPISGILVDEQFAENVVVRHAGLQDYKLSVSLGVYLRGDRAYRL